MDFIREASVLTLGGALGFLLGYFACAWDTHRTIKRAKEIGAQELDSQHKSGDEK